MSTISELIAKHRDTLSELDADRKKAEQILADNLEKLDASDLSRYTSVGNDRVVITYYQKYRTAEMGGTPVKSVTYSTQA